MTESKPNKIRIGLLIDEDLLAQVRAETIESSDPYAPTQTDLIIRGMQLALEERARLKESMKRRGK